MTTLSVETLDLRAQPATKPRAISAAFVAICIVCALLGRFAYLIEPFNGDGAMFAYMGKLAAEGGRFGVDLIDNKFPTVGFITSPFWRIFGDFWPGYVIAQTILSFATAGLLTRAAVRHFGEESRWATFLPAIVLLNVNAVVMGGFQLETIQTFFACLAGACALEGLKSHDARDSFAAGLCAGCATLVKPTGGAVLAAFLFALLLRKATPSPGNPGEGRGEGFDAIARKAQSARTLTLTLSRITGRGKRVASALIGFALPLLAALWWLIESDQLRILPDIARQIGEYASSTSFDPFDLYRPLSLLFLFGMAMLIRGWVFRRQAVRTSSTSPMWVFLIAWLALEFIGVLMQRRMYAYHFLPLAGPAALLFGAIPRRTTTGQLAGVLALPIFFGFWGSIETIQTAQAHPPTWPAVVTWLKDHTRPGERVWIDVTPNVLLTTDLRPASRVQLTFIFMNSDESPTRFSKILIDDLKTTRPRYVVLPADVDGYVNHHITHVSELARIPARRENFTQAWKSIEENVKSDYQVVETIGKDAIWQRRGQNDQ